MGCQIGKVIIVNNGGTIIFGNVGTINITSTSVSTGSSNTDEGTGNNGNPNNNQPSGTKSEANSDVNRNAVPYPAQMQRNLPNSKRKK